MKIAEEDYVYQINGNFRINTDCSHICFSSSKEGDPANSETESEVVVEEEPKDESDCDSYV
jgi:hypothetical protein